MDAVYTFKKYFKIQQILSKVVIPFRSEVMETSHCTQQNQQSSLWESSSRWSEIGPNEWQSGGSEPRILNLILCALMKEQQLNKRDAGHITLFSGVHSKSAETLFLLDKTNKWSWSFVCHNTSLSFFYGSSPLWWCRLLSLFDKFVWRCCWKYLVSVALSHVLWLLQVNWICCFNKKIGGRGVMAVLGEIHCHHLR